MAQSVSIQSPAAAPRLLFGFIAGFVATLIFHQIGLMVLRFLGITPAMPYNMNPVPPFGVPQFISLSFWGGVRGIVFVLVEPWLARGPGGDWGRRCNLRRGLPDAGSLCLSFYLSEACRPAIGFHFPGILIGPIVNGLWGLGTAVFLSWMPGSVPQTE